MTKLPKDAQTLSEWSKPRYAREHRVMFVLLGFLVGAIVWPISILHPETQSYISTAPSDMNTVQSCLVSSASSVARACLTVLATSSPGRQ